MKHAFSLDVPEGWSFVHLSDIAEKIVGGGTPPRKMAEYYTGDIPWVTVKDLNGMLLEGAQEHITREAIAKSASNIIPEGNVILATRMAVGSAHLNTVNVAINQDLKAIFTKSDVSPEYLVYWLRLHAQSIKALSTGSTVKGIRLEQIRTLPFPKPPIREQRKIAAILSSIDDALEANQAVLEQLTVMKKGLLEKLFAYGLGTEEDLVRGVPKNWELLNLKDLGKGQVVRTGPFGSSLKGEHFSEKGVPVITIGSLGEGVLETDALMYVPEAKAEELKAYRVKSGDLVFSRVADVGRSVRITEEAEGWLMSSNLIRIRVDRRRYNPQFLMYAITKSPFVVKQIERQTSSGGRQVVTSSILSEFIFAMPPLDEQQKIVSILDSVDIYARATQDKKHQLLAVKQGLMQQLLTGKLRVTV